MNLSKIFLSVSIVALSLSGTLGCGQLNSSGGTPELPLDEASTTATAPPGDPPQELGPPAEIIPPAEPALHVSKSVCLNRSPEKIKIPEVHSGVGAMLDLGVGESFDFRGISLVANDPVYPLVIRSAATEACVTGLKVTGKQPTSVTWVNMKHHYDGDGILFKVAVGSSFILENSFFENTMDSFSPRANSNSSQWTVRRIYSRGNRDDFVENDQCLPGIIDDVFVDGTYMFLSQRPGAGANGTCAATNTTIIKNALVRLECQSYGDMDSGQPTKSCGPGTGVGQLFKWGRKAGPVQVSDSIFLVPSMSVNGARSMGFPPGTYSNVTLIWLGNGPYPAPLPNGVKLRTDYSIFENAKAAWLKLHGCSDSGDSCSFTEN